MHTISLGGVIGFVVECFEEGIVTRDDLGGLGKELPAHMPTSKAIISLIYGVNPFGPDPVSAEHGGAVASEPGEALKGVGIRETIPNLWEMNDAKLRVVVKSMWSLLSIEDLVAVVTASTGWRFTMHELMLLESGGSTS